MKQMNKRIEHLIEKTLLIAAVFIALLVLFGIIPLEKKDIYEDLYKSAGDGDLLKITNLVETSKLDINRKNKDGEAALHLAVLNGNSAIVKLLIEHNASVNASIDINIKNKKQRQIKGVTPLMIASKEGHLAIVKLLVENGANINTHAFTENKDHSIAVYTAYSLAKTKEIKEYLQQKEAEI